MVKTADLNLLISDVVSENHYRHCRLCLNRIKDEYVKFDDFVCLDVDVKKFRPLNVILGVLLGSEIFEEIAGVDAVCPGCVDMALQSCRFVQMCQNSTVLLNKTFDNLTNMLKVEIELEAIENHSMYVMVNGSDSKIVILENEAPDSKPSHVLKDFKCQKCDENFDNLVELKVHNVAGHGIVTCDVCLETFLDEEELETHRNIGHKSEYKCESCFLYMASAESIREHEMRVHTRYICKDCGKSCKGLNRLQAHEEKHVVKSQCPKCGKTYITKDFYMKHVKLCLEDRLEPHPYRAKIEKTLFCEKCGKGYSTYGGLRVHDRFVHGNAKPHICKQCGKKFTAPSYLKIHMVKHTGEKKFNCNICGNNFVSKEALLYHTRRHTGEKPYSCRLCSERFVNASARAEHIKFKHAAPTLSCEICSRKFFTANFLRQHISRHHDPSSKLYSGRSMIPPNVPGEQNMRCKIDNEVWAVGYPLI